VDAEPVELESIDVELSFDASCERRGEVSVVVVGKLESLSGTEALIAKVGGREVSD